MSGNEEEADARMNDAVWRAGEKKRDGGERTEARPAVSRARERGRRGEYERLCFSGAVGGLCFGARTCERSTIIPSRFISRTTSTPNGASPPATCGRASGTAVSPSRSVAASAQLIERAARREKKVLIEWHGWLPLSGGRNCSDLVEPRADKKGSGGHHARVFRGGGV